MLPPQCVGVEAVLPPEVARPFKIIAFDWDGTAVMSRREDASQVRAFLENLLRFGLPIVIITGTSFTNIDRQLSAAIRGQHKQNLYVSTNRGSEVYGFDNKSQPILLWQRKASAEENRLLTEIADAVREHIVTTTGLDIRVIYNRLNRRKIDLIPLPEWHDPPKSAIDDLLEAVELRLKGAGLSGGLREVFDLAHRVAREKGLQEARITSDVKHIEVGLTDKGDAINWTLHELALRMGISPEGILIGGDEFGPLAGFEGSDYQMVAPQAKGAVFFSVGVEPNGVPPEVIHLGGGPSQFRKVIECQVALHNQRRQPESERVETLAPALDLPAIPTDDPDWLLIEEGFNLVREHEIESLFALSNGYVGVRGSLAEGSSLSSPATFLAGVFDADPQTDSIPELAIAPDWSRLRVIVEGKELKLEEGKFLAHRRVLDMRQGILWREWRHRDPTGRVTRLRFLRLASIADRHVLLQSATITPENYSGHVLLETIIEQPLAGEGRYLAAGPQPISMPPTLIPVRSSSPSPRVSTLRLRTETTGVAVALTTSSQLQGESRRQIEGSVECKRNRIIERWDCEAEIGETYRLDRLVSVYTSRETDQPAKMSAAHLQQLLDAGIEAVIDAHVRAWEQRWEAADVVVCGDKATQRALRFAVYHLISASNPDDERVSIGARALTGHVYKGHVFWDTEIYMLPFYVFTHPLAARALLMYRYHALPPARQKARALGYRGALYPWESAHSGEETTPPFALTPEGEVIPTLSGEMEHHISADIAYAVWQYWQVTGDDDFFVNAGAEIVLETARFWASRGQIERDGHYHIRHVIGPDEYHEDVDDSAFTNVMAQWNLERGADIVRILGDRWPERWQQLAERLEIAPLEWQEWLNLAGAMYTGFDPETGLFEQFRGYFELEEIDLSAYEERTVPMDVLLGRDRIQRSKVIKQADVVLLIYLLWDRFPAPVREANFRYYEPRTGHGSSLSPSIHALVAARLGDFALAERYLQQGMEIDLANNMGNAAGGIHAAAIGGLWQAIVFGFGGTRLQADGLAFAPQLLHHWRKLFLQLQWRGRELQANLAQKPLSIEVQLKGDGSTTIDLPDNIQVKLVPGQRLLARRDDSKWKLWHKRQHEGVDVPRGKGDGYEAKVS